MSTPLHPNTDDVELIRAHAEATRKVGYPGYAHAARHSPADYDGERQYWREARYMKPPLKSHHPGLAPNTDEEVIF